jgi:hypothetical protein
LEQNTVGLPKHHTLSATHLVKPGRTGAVAFEFAVDGQVEVTNGAFDPTFAQLLG